MVRAKFRVQSITEDNSGKSIKLLPVTTGSEENKSFFRWTPSGVIDLIILNPAASGQFKVDKQYYVDFTEAERETDGQ